MTLVFFSSCVEIKSATNPVNLTAILPSFGSTLNYCEFFCNTNCYTLLLWYSHFVCILFFLIEVIIYCIIHR